VTGNIENPTHPGTKKKQNAKIFNFLVKIITSWILIRFQNGFFFIKGGLLENKIKAFLAVVEQVLTMRLTKTRNF